MKNRDYQRARVYKWERECLIPLSINKKDLSLQECRDLIRDVLDKSKHWKKEIKLHDGRGHKNAISYGGCIALPKWARQTIIVLHELAHELSSFYCEEPHGPKFVSTYIDLIHITLDIPKETLKREAKDMGVDYRW